jgi:hypothetical protein
MAVETRKVLESSCCEIVDRNDDVAARDECVTEM